MNAKATVIGIIFGFVIGLLSGLSIYSTFLCADTNDAVVEQIKDDSEKLTKARIVTEVKYVYRDKIKTVIKAVPAGECFDRIIPADAINGLFDAQRAERP